MTSIRSDPLLVDVVAVSPYFLVQVTDAVQAISRVRLQGNPKLAVELANVNALHTTEVLTKSLSMRSLEPLLRILGLLLLEQGKGYREILAYRELLPSAKRVAKEVTRIAKESNDTELWALADIHLGDAYYILGDAYWKASEHDASLKEKSLECLTNSVHFLTRGFDSLTSVDDKLWALRLLAASWTYLHDARQFEEAEDKAKEYIEQGLFSGVDNACMVHEGLARSYAILGKPNRGFQALEDARQIYGRGYQ